MSHVAMIKLRIKNLEALAKACEKIGLKLKLGKKTYRWYGQHVGDYPLPKGFTKDEMGKCDHCISVVGNNQAYEIGVCKARDGSDGYILLWDFWSGGYGLEKAVGKDCQNLVTEYTKEVAREEVTSLAKAQGWSSKETYNEQTGETVFTLRKY